MLQASSFIKKTLRLSADLNIVYEAESVSFNNNFSEDTFSGKNNLVGVVEPQLILYWKNMQ